jgi:hypothetical protein
LLIKVFAVVVEVVVLVVVVVVVVVVFFVTRIKDIMGRIVGLDFSVVERILIGWWWFKLRLDVRYPTIRRKLRYTSLRLRNYWGFRHIRNFLQVSVSLL